MNCQEFKKHIEGLIQGDAEDKLKLEMESHMDKCIFCREEYESTKSILDAIKIDASSIHLNDRQKKDIKESILRAPLRKKRGFQEWARSLMYVAAIFMFITVGVYFAGGVNINLGPAGSSVEDEKANRELLEQINVLQGEKAILMEEISELQGNEKGLRSYIKDLESGKARDWMMVNANLYEALIEGEVLSVDKASKSIVLEVYLDDNTPDIDPKVTIPDGIMITRVEEEPLENGKYTISEGSVEDLNIGDHITIHYLGKLKSARALLLYK